MTFLPSNDKLPSFLILCISLSISNGSIVSGVQPSSPNSIAKNVPCPLPVNANEPYKST